MNRTKLEGHIFAFVANLLFAVNLSVSKYLLPWSVTPEALTFFRVFFSGAIFWILSLFMEREKITRKDAWMIFLCSLCGIVLNQELFLQGLNLTSPMDASIISTNTPIFVMIIAAFILKEPITHKKAFGVLLGVIGAVVLIVQSSHTVNTVSTLEGNMLVVGSGIAYSFYLVLAKPLTLRYSSVTIMKWMFLFSVIMLLPFSYRSVLETPMFYETPVNPLEIGALAFILIGGTFIPYLLTPMSLKRIRPTTASMYNYAQPVVTSMLAIWLGQDRFSITKLLCAFLIFIGVYLVTQSKSREEVEASKNK